MKRFMTLLLGVAFALGSVGATFAADPPADQKKEEKGKGKGKGKGKKKKQAEDEQKKQ